MRYYLKQRWNNFYSFYFAIASDELTPSTITKRLGVRPDQERIKWTRGRTPVTNIWRLESAYNDAGKAAFGDQDQLEAHWASILSRMKGKEPIVRELVSEGAIAEFTLWINNWRERPPLVFEEEKVAAISAFGAALQIDSA